MHRILYWLSIKSGLQSIARHFTAFSAHRPCAGYLCVSSNILLWHLSMLLYYSRNTVQNIQIRNLNKIPPPRKQKRELGPQSCAILPRNARAGRFLTNRQPNANSCFVFYLSITLWVKGSQGPTKPVLQIKIHETGSFLFDWRKLTIFTITRRQDLFYACTLESIARGLWKVYMHVQTLYIVQLPV